jgi:hypothetical protein
MERIRDWWTKGSRDKGSKGQRDQGTKCKSAPRSSPSPPSSLGPSVSVPPSPSLRPSVPPLHDVLPYYVPPCLRAPLPSIPSPPMSPNVPECQIFRKILSNKVLNVADLITKISLPSIAHAMPVGPFLIR